MKKLITILSLFFTLNTFATTYYFAASGSDAAAGTSTSFPFQTIAKFNSIFASKSPGDNFLFNRGDVFYGTLIISRNGSSGLPITIGAYGTGAQPIITGFTNAGAWTNLGSNIWETTGAISTLPYTNMVVISGVNTPMGRFPNVGTYFSFQSHSGVVQITSTDLSGATNWTGAELAVNLTTGRIVRNLILSQSGTTLTFQADPEGAGFQSDNQRFIIQNDPRTLDVQNEWYYNPSTEKLRVYSTVSPVGVQIATLDSLVVLTGRSYITFDNIYFQGANTEAIQVNHSTNVTVQNCSFNFLGRNAVFGSKTGSSLNCIVNNCTINHCNDNSIDLPRVDFDFATVTNNNTKNCGMIYGAMDRNDGINNAATAQGISVFGASCVIENNIIDSVGYIGIHFWGSNTLIENNFIQDFCLLFNDGGAIYSWNGSGATVQTGIKILDNICLNKNTFSSVNGADYGIYLDDLTNNCEVAYNTCANSSWGFELHNVFDINLHDNTTFNNSMAPIILISDAGAGFVTGHTNMDSITIVHNIFFSNTSGQKTFWRYSARDSSVEPMIPIHFRSDSNYFARPTDGSAAILTNFQASGFTEVLRNWTIPGWQGYSGGDAHSLGSPVSETDTSKLKFVYNASSVPSTQSLGANYTDLATNSYAGVITLAPFSSAVLLYNSPIGNIAPTAHAGSDQAVDSTIANLSGTGTDVDGTIASYLWTKISGPGTTTITNNTSQNATASNLQAGTYDFRLTVTDNLGATGTDDMIVVMTTGRPSINFFITNGKIIFK